MFRAVFKWLPASCALLALAAAAETQEWPQFRGLYRNGISPETGVLRAWPEGGAPELWRRPIGAAFSGIAVADGHLYTTESDDEGDYLLKLDPTDGRTLWRRRIAPVYVESFGNGPRATPTVDGDRIFVLSGDGHLAAVHRADGKILWSRDLKADFGAEVPQWGFASAPLVLGKRLVVDAGAPQRRAVIAFDRANGEVLWTAGEGQVAYGSPVVMEFDGHRHLVLVHKPGLLGLSPDGEELWRHEWFSGNSIKPSLPLVVGPDLLFVSASYGAGAMVVRLTADNGKLRAEEVWKNQVMRNHFNSSVLVDGKVYGFDNATLKCVDPRTGDQQWARRGGLGKGSLIYADGLLIVLTETGALKLVEATPAAYTELASHRVLSGRCWTEPTLAGGRLYLRNREEMVALDLRSRSASSARPEGVVRSGGRSPGAGTEELALEQIIARHLEAHGGLERLRALRSLRLRGVYEVAGVGRPFTLSQKRPGRYRFETEYEGQPAVRASDGKIAWTIDPDDGPGAQLVEERLAQLVAEDYGALPGPLVDAEGRGRRLELVGEAELDGVPAYHLRVHLPSGRSQDCFLSQESYLLLQWVVTANSPYFGDYPREYWNMEHQEHEGLVLPSFVERVDGPFVSTLRIESVEINPELDEALFRLP